MPDHNVPPRFRDRLFTAWRYFEGILLCTLFFGAVGAIVWALFGVARWVR